MIKVGKYSYLALLMTPLVATGCAPKNESALIYSSAMSGGLNLQTPNITDGQIKITLGYATTDFAYVPVAAGYGCDIPGEGADENKDEHKGSSKCKGLERLHGDKTDEKSDDVAKRQYEEAERAAQLQAKTLSETKKQHGIARVNYDTAIASLVDIDSATQLYRSSDETITANKKIYNSIIKSQKIVADYAMNCGLFYSPENFQKIAEEAKNKKTTSNPIDDKAPYDLGYLCALNNTEGAKQKVAELSVQLQKDEQAEKSASEYRKILATYTDANSRRRDAYSVFGTFEHNGTASPPAGDGKGGAAASLTAGKIFATGVAAQNLTEGIQAHLQHACVEQVRSVAPLITDDKARSDLVASMVTQCLAKTSTAVTPPSTPATPPVATPPAPPSTNQPSAG